MIPRLAGHPPNASGTAGMIARMIFVFTAIYFSNTAHSQTVTTGHRSATSVSVDLSVLDQLGEKPKISKDLQPSAKPLLIPKIPASSVKRAVPRMKPRRSSTPAFNRTLKLRPPMKIPSRPLATPQTLEAPTLPRKVPPTIQSPTQATVSTQAVKTSIQLLPRLEKNHKPPPETISLGRRFRFGFHAESAIISSTNSAKLDGIAHSLKRKSSLRLQVLAYAGDKSETPSHARRLSLSRALAVRSYLINEGVRGPRIDVRALGNRSQGGPPDRVDVIITSR